MNPVPNKRSFESMPTGESRSERAARESAAHAWWFLPILLWTSLCLPGPACAAAGEEKILTIAKNTLLGAATGLILGGALALVVHKGDREDVVRWSVAVGTFGGFGFGVYQATRPEDKSVGGFSRHLPARHQGPTGAGGQADPLAWGGRESYAVGSTACLPLGMQAGIAGLGTEFAPTAARLGLDPHVPGWSVRNIDGRRSW